MGVQRWSDVFQRNQERLVAFQQAQTAQAQSQAHAAENQALKAQAAQYEAHIQAQRDHAKAEQSAADEVIDQKRREADALRSALGMAAGHGVAPSASEGASLPPGVGDIYGRTATSVQEDKAARAQAAQAHGSYFDLLMGERAGAAGPTNGAGATTAQPTTTEPPMPGIVAPGTTPSPGAALPPLPADDAAWVEEAARAILAGNGSIEEAPTDLQPYLRAALGAGR